MSADETLARRLQFEEQTQSAIPSSSSNLSSQELRDMNVARQFARMDLEGHGSLSTSNTTVPHGNDNVARRDDLDHGSPHRRKASTSSLPEKDDRKGYASMNTSHQQVPASYFQEERKTCSVGDLFLDRKPASLPVSQGGRGVKDQVQEHRRISSIDSPLEIARRLQAQAFSDLHRPSIADTNTQTSEESDLELALRMQIQEQEYSQGRGWKQDKASASMGTFGIDAFRGGNSTRLNQEAEDELLARSMAGGDSIHELSNTEQLRDMLVKIESPSKSRIMVPNVTGPAIHRIDSPVKPSRPLPPSYASSHSPYRNSPVTSHHSSARIPAKSAPATPAGGYFAKRAGSRAMSSNANIRTDPPGVNLPESPLLHVSSPSREKKKKKRGILGFGGRSRRDAGERKLSAQSVLPAGIASVVPPAAIPPPPGGSISIPPVFSRASPPPGGGISVPASITGPLPHSVSMKRDASQNMSQTGNRGPPSSSTSSCSTCHQMSGSLLQALGRMYHPACFRCVTCNEAIDQTSPFAFSTDVNGQQFPHHRKCFAELFGIQCTVCRQTIPAGPDGTVSYVKHPFFDTEEMCPWHARNPGRRCAGCHRFEPEDEPFADLNDAGRCLCYACCRSVIIDSRDVKPLWGTVLTFFEKRLQLPVWNAMREVPILMVGYDALNDEMKRSRNVHGNSSQIMTRGLCLTEHADCNLFKLPRMRFNESSNSFEARDMNHKDFEYFDVQDASKSNPTASVFAILCLSGLPRDLTASILAHEAVHAWIKLHPGYDARKPLPPQVEEGCAQLIAMLFLNEGLDPSSPSDGDGPSDERLRQFFRFSIETDDNEIYGTGYRRAAIAFRDIGIEALMNHIVHYGEYPRT